MLYLLGEIFEQYYGPFRLLTSHLLLIVTGLSGSFIITWIFLPKSFSFLPYDRGREFAIGSRESKGKPTGAGFVFISICIIFSFLVVPFATKQLYILILTFFAMLSGYLDDKSPNPWSEYKKGIIDLIIAVSASLVIVQGQELIIWLPFTKNIFHLSPVTFVLLSTTLIWLSINTTNCSDGVDGLSGTLVLLALLAIGTFLYFIVGHIVISKYLLLPYYVESPAWAIMIFTFIGGIGGYLWHNAHPSVILMGDAGSRALGFFMGVAIIITGNPFLILIACCVIFINGGTGLVKLALLRFLRIKIFQNIRFPLHDYFRQVKKWSNTQVLVRFTLMQLLITILLFGILIKVR